MFVFGIYDDGIGAFYSYTAARWQDLADILQIFAAFWASQLTCLAHLCYDHVSTINLTPYCG
jgi:hypothetical protein